MSALKTMHRPIKNHVGAGVAKANPSGTTTEESVVGKKLDTTNKAVPSRGPRAPEAPRAPAKAAPTVASTARSEPPMDVDPGELIPTTPPAAKPALDHVAPLALDDADMDLEDDNETMMFKRPEPAVPSGPPRRPPPPKPATPSAKPVAKPPLPAPTRVAAEKPMFPVAKAADKPAPPAKPVAKPPPPKAAPSRTSEPQTAASKAPQLKAPTPKIAEPRAEEKPFLAVPVPSGAPAPKLSEAPLFEVTLGSEKPLLATPEAGEISLFAPKAPNMPLLAAPQASELGSLDIKPQGAPMPALPMLDFSRDITALTRQSARPIGAGTRLVGFARTHAKWLAMAGGTVAIAAASWMVFHAAAAGSSTATTPNARTPLAGQTVPAAAAARAAATTQPAVATQPVAAVEPAPTGTTEPAAVAPAEPAPAEKAPEPEAPAAAAAPAEVAARPAAPPAEPREAPAPAERTDRSAGTATAEPRGAATARSTAPTERPATRATTPAAEPTTELPSAKPEPPPPRPAAPAGPSVGEMDGTPDFDQSAAMAALRQAAESAKRCATSDPPNGGVRIAVTFARTGAVSATQVEGPAAGTPLGDCIIAKFQSAHVPPFRGSVMTVRKTVMF
jgi:hypothetical protein